jgi:hypothetical protein
VCSRLDSFLHFARRRAPLHISRLRQGSERQVFLRSVSHTNKIVERADSLPCCLNSLFFALFFVSLVTEEASVALTQAAQNPQLADHSRALAMEAEGAVLWRAATNQRSRPQSFA